MKLIDEMIEKQQFKIDFLESEIVDDFMVQEIELRNEFIKSLQSATPAEIEIEERCPYEWKKVKLEIPVCRKNCDCGRAIYTNADYCIGCGAKIKRVS